MMIALAIVLGIAAYLLVGVAVVAAINVCGGDDSFDGHAPLWPLTLVMLAFVGLDYLLKRAVAAVAAGVRRLAKLCQPD